MSDLSHLDKKYFLDYRRYNCPFCNRGSVSYVVEEKFGFNWSNDRVVYVYFIRCGEDDCENMSMHLSDHYFSGSFKYSPSGVDSEDYNSKELDSYFFYHQPTSFFTLDSRINERIRSLVSEAENSLKMNFLVGASGCLRKGIYELIEHEDVREETDNGKTDYQESIKNLKDKFNKVPAEYFDALAGIQEMTSDNMHEGSWEEWSADKLKTLINLTKNVLHEMYVVPEEQKKRVGVASNLLSKFKSDKKVEDEK